MSAKGELPGEVMVPNTSWPEGAAPRLPAEATTTTPLPTTRATERQSGSVAHGPITECPSDRLTTLMP